MDYRQKHLVISIGSCWRRAHLSLLLALLIALASGLATALPARATIITISDEPSCQSVGGVWDDRCGWRRAADVYNGRVPGGIYE
jgi:hypothetical protein